MTEAANAFGLDMEDARTVWRRVAQDHGAGDFAGPWTGTLIREIAAALARRSYLGRVDWSVERDKREAAEARADRLVALAKQVCAPDAAGRALSDLLLVAASSCDARGGGPLVTCLRLKAHAIREAEVALADLDVKVSW